MKRSRKISVSLAYFRACSKRVKFRSTVGKAAKSVRLFCAVHPNSSACKAGALFDQPQDRRNDVLSLCTASAEADCWMLRCCCRWSVVETRMKSISIQSYGQLWPLNTKGQQKKNSTMVHKNEKTWSYEFAFWKRQCGLSRLYDFWFVIIYLMKLKAVLI